MSVELKTVNVICPVCQVQAKIQIPIFLVKEAQDGVLKVQVPKGACCQEHAFMAFIDKKFTVRGYQNVDIAFQGHVKTQEPSLEDKAHDYDIDDFMTAVGPDIAALVLRAIIVGIPILLMESKDLYNRIDKIVEVLHEMESDDLIITAEKITRDELKEKRSNPNKTLIIAPLYSSVIRSPFGNEVRTRFESALLNEVTSNIPDRRSEIIFLRKELVKIRKIIEEFVSMLKGVNKFYEEDIPGFIMEKFNYKIDAKNVDVIKEIIEFKYGKDLAKRIINKSLDKIRSDLW